MNKKNISASFQFHWMMLFAVVSLLGSGLLVFTLREFFDLGLGDDFGKAFTTLRSLETLLLPIITFSILFYTAVVCVLAVFIILYVSRSVTAPLLHVEEVARHIRGGYLSFPAEVRSGEQLQELVKAVEDLRKAYESEIHSLGPHLETMDASWQKIDDASPEKYVETALQELALIKVELEAIRSRLSS
jgi:nitrogen fixation/metabolism regulation signal transduction histidine kinase